MNTRITIGLMLAACCAAAPSFGQAPAGSAPSTQAFVDSINGLSLEEAISRALEQEPSLRAARADVDVATGMRVQASLRPNPVVSFERREEPAGTDNLTSVGIEWPLDLFRRARRVAVAERELTAARLDVGDRERLLAAEVRTRYGDAVEAIRSLRLLDELLAATQQQHTLLRARVDEGASPPIERDLVDVELRRLQSDRLLQVARTETAMFELKRVLGMRTGDRLTLRDTLDALAREESPAPGVPPTADAIEKRADVRAAAARVDVAQAEIDRALSDRRVDVSLTASYMRMDAAFPQTAFALDGSLTPVRGLFHYVSAGAMVTIPVLNRNQGQIAAARAQRTAAAATAEATRLAAETELAAAAARDARAREAVSLYAAGAQGLARQNLTVVRQSHELGRVTIFEVLAEQRRYLELERGYTEALRAAYDARTALLRARGELR